MVVLQYNTSPADGETNDRCPKNTWGFVIINLESYLPCDTTGAFVLREWGQRLLGQNRMVWESITQCHQLQLVALCGTFSNHLAFFMNE